MIDFWMHPLTASLNEAIAGPVLDSVNSNFTQDLLRYFPYVHKVILLMHVPYLHDLMKVIPSWWVPEPYRLQRQLVQDVKQ